MKKFVIIFMENYHLEKTMYFCPNLKYNFNIVQLSYNNLLNK